MLILNKNRNFAGANSRPSDQKADALPLRYLDNCWKREKFGTISIYVYQSTASFLKEKRRHSGLKTLKTARNRCICLSKGRLIPKCPFGVIFLTLKRDQIKKIRALYTTNWMISFWLLHNIVFWFDLFLGARAEILTKLSLVFWSIGRHQKNISKLTD